MIKIEILDKNRIVRTGRNEYDENPLEMTATGQERVYLATQDLTYALGDFIRVTTDAPGKHLMVKLNEALDTTLIYLSDTVWEYIIPLAEGDAASLCDGAFASKAHYISARYAKDYEIKQYRNLALNPHDQRDCANAFPHASANVETRNDSTFFAKNAIDGSYANNSHGSYPSPGWGINRDPNAKLKIDFGREVRVDSASFTLRADFPHDSYWTQVSLSFSEGSSLSFDTVKTADTQSFNFTPIVTRYAVFENLIKAGDESPFPALTQIEIYGTEV